MAKMICPDCGFVHECESNLDVSETKANRMSKLRVSKGYSLYYVPCPYARVHNAKGKAALEGEVGEQLKAMREASARIRRDHFSKIHGTTRYSIAKISQKHLSYPVVMLSLLCFKSPTSDLNPKGI